MRLLVSHTHTPQREWGARTHRHTHTLFVSIRPPAAGSFIRWLDTPRCVLLLANAQQRIRGADNHHWRGEREKQRGGEGREILTVTKWEALKKKKIVLWKVHKTKTGNALLQPGLIHQHHDINRGNPTSNKICWYAPNLLCQIHFGGHVAVQRAHQKEFRVDGVMQDAPCVAHVRQLNHLKWGKDCEFG